MSKVDRKKLGPYLRAMERYGATVEVEHKPELPDTEPPESRSKVSRGPVEEVEVEIVFPALILKSFVNDMTGEKGIKVTLQLPEVIF